jgi:RND family efflux transporter MFP subunit
MISSKRKSIALVALLTVAAAWLWAHEGHQALPTRGVVVDAERGLVTLGPEAARALDVELVEVRNGALAEELVAPATVAAPWQRHAYVSTRLGGTVTALHVQPGQALQRGQKVAEVESLELADLQRELLDARNAVGLSEKTLQRLEALAARGASSDQSLHQARSAHQQNQNALEIARRKLLGMGLPTEAIDKLLRDGAPTMRALSIVSPLAGLAVHVDVRVGQTVEPMEHLLEVIDPAKVWVQIRVLEKDLSRVQVGQQARFRLPVSPPIANAPGSPTPVVDVPASPGSGWSGTVHVKERYLDPQTHWGTAWVELANPGGRLLPGMVGEARLRTRAAGAGLMLPTSAVVAAGAERYVFVEEGPGQYRRQNLVIEKERGDEVLAAVGSGLYPGDRVVTAGSHQLASLFVQGVLRPSPEAARRIGLRIEPARRQRVAEVVTLGSVVELPPSGRAIVSSRLAGVLSRIAVEPDQAVRTGDVIAEVASPELQNLQLDLLRTHLQLQLEEDTLKRLRATSDSVPERVIVEAANSVRVTRQRHTSLRTKLREAGLSAEQILGVMERRAIAEGLPVRVPISGVVVRFRAVLGQAIKAEVPLFEVHDLSRANLRVLVPEGQLHQVRVGQRGRVRMTGETGFTGEAVVVRRGLVVEDRSRTVPFWAELKTPPPTPLLPGMLGRMTVILAELPLTLAVPRGALLEEGANRYVFVRRTDGTFERRLVETGRADDRFVEITRGLAEGEAVAVSGVAELQTGYASIQ